MTRGYCERTADPHDRRRTVLVLTERGRSAARGTRRAIRRAIDEVDRHLAFGAGPEAVASVLAGMGREARNGRAAS